MHVDEGLREAVRRLVGRGLPIVLDNSPAAQDARAGCACYLTERIQSAPAQKPGRKPDMSPQATAALLAVLEEVWTHVAATAPRASLASLARPQSGRYSHPR
jgi:hypothetical protein